MRNILIADDCDDDVLLTQVACRRSGIEHQVQVVHDGRAVIQYLSGEAPYSDRTQFPFPDLIFMDVRMPRMDGFQVLQVIRETPAWRTLPVVIFSNDYHDARSDRAHAAGATSYMHKDADLARHSEDIRIVLHHWFAPPISPTRQLASTLSNQR